MVEAAMQGANCTAGAIWGSVSCSRTLWHAAQLSPGELGFEPVTFRSLDDLLYLLSYINNKYLIMQSDILSNHHWLLSTFTEWLRYNTGSKIMKWQKSNLQYISTKNKKMNKGKRSKLWGQAPKVRPLLKWKIVFFSAGHEGTHDPLLILHCSSFGPAVWIRPATVSNETNYVSHQSIIPSNWTNINLIDWEQGSRST